MNTHKILLGALLIKPDLAPYSLPELEIEYFARQMFNQYSPPCLAFGMRPGSWTLWRLVPDTLS